MHRVKNPWNQHSLRSSAKAHIYTITRSRDEQHDTSVTLPIFQIYRLKAAKNKLKQAGISVTRGQLIADCIRMLNPKIRRPQECNTTRVRRKNKTLGRYQKVSLTWEAEDYNKLLMLADHARVCHSFLADVALRLYLQVVVQLLLGGRPVQVQFPRWRGNNFKFIKKVLTCQNLHLLQEGLRGIYQRKTMACSRKKLIYSSSWSFF